MMELKEVQWSSVLSCRAITLCETIANKQVAVKLFIEPCHEKTCFLHMQKQLAFLARLHEVQKSYCSHPGRTRSRSRSTLR